MLAPVATAAAMRHAPGQTLAPAATNKAAISKLLALTRFVFTHKSARAVRSRRLLLLAAASTTGVTALVHCVARAVCRTPLESAHLALRVALTVASTVAQFFVRGCRPLYPTWTFRFEVLRAVMRCTTELYGHRTADEVHAKRIRHLSEVYGTSVGWIYAKVHRSRVEPVYVNGLEHIWIKDAESSTVSSGSDAMSSKNRFVVVYYHGGGYAVLSPRMYIGFCNTLRTAIRDALSTQCPEAASGAVHIDFLLANYRKVPEHPFPVPAEDALAMYEHVVEDLGVPPSQIIVAGDSAGGGLVMSTLLRLRDAGKQHLLPRAAMLCCPAVDLSVADNADGDGADVIARPHCVLSASLIAACRERYHLTRDDRSTWLDASPVHCDLRGLPPVFLQTATLDLIAHHAHGLMAKATADGVSNWELDVQPDVPHVFTVFPTPVLPHAMVGVDSMARFAATHFVAAWRDSCGSSASASAATANADGA